MKSKKILKERGAERLVENVFKEEERRETEKGVKIIRYEKGEGRKEIRKEAR